MPQHQVVIQFHSGDGVVLKIPQVSGQTRPMRKVLAHLGFIKDGTEHGVVPHAEGAVPGLRQKKWLIF